MHHDADVLHLFVLRPGRDFDLSRGSFRLAHHAVVPGFRVIYSEGITWLARLVDYLLGLEVDLPPSQHSLAPVHHFVGAWPPLHYK